MIWLNQLKSLFVHCGQNWSFCRYWNNGVDQCVGSCTHVCQWFVTCGKSWEIAEIFTLPFPPWFLAACKLCSGFKNLEVRLMISRNWRPGRLETEEGFISLCLQKLLSVTACFRINEDFTVDLATKYWNFVHRDIIKLLDKCLFSLNGFIDWTSNARCRESAYLCVVFSEWERGSWYRVQLFLPLSCAFFHPLKTFFNILNAAVVWWIGQILVHSCVSDDPLNATGPRTTCGLRFKTQLT